MLLFTEHHCAIFSARVSFCSFVRLQTTAELPCGVKTCPPPRLTERTTEAQRQHALEVKKPAKENKLSQLATVSQGGRSRTEGIREASRKLKIDKDAAHRAIKIDTITPEAKQVARANGLDKNQSALLKVAAAEPERQVEVVQACIKAADPDRRREKHQCEADEAHAAVAELRRLLGVEFDGFRDRMRTIDPVRFKEALFETRLAKAS